MSKIFDESAHKKKSDFFRENKFNSDTKPLPKSDLLNIDLSESEEEIIDELINRKIPNNIRTINFNNIKKIPKKLPIKTKPKKIKSKHICHSADSIKSKKMKLKDWLNNNIENTNNIEKEIEDLILEIFVNRFNSYPEKDYPLTENALESKKQIELYCSKFHEFSIYLLYMIYIKFYSFFEYLSKKIDYKSLTISDINKIKEILYLTGIDIKIVFKKAFEKTCDFNLSSILIIIFDEYLVKEKKIKICKEIKNSQFYQEKEKFENYLKIVKQNIYFFDSNSEIGLDKGISNDYKKYEENIYIENNNNKENENEKNNDILIGNKNINEDEEEEEEIKSKKSNEEEEEESKSKKSINEEEENNDINDINLLKQELLINDNNNKSNKENYQINNVNNNNLNNNINNNENNNINGVNKEKNKNKKIEKNEENINIIQNLGIDDLVNYINYSENKINKKKRKKKKKGKIQENINEEKEKQENDYIEEDIVIINYKQALEEFTKNVKNTPKIKPEYSEKFLKKIQKICQQI